MALKYLRTTNLLEVRKEKIAEEKTKATTTQLISDLMVESKKKDMLIGQLTQTVNNLNIEVEKLKGGNK